METSAGNATVVTKLEGPTKPMCPANAGHPSHKTVIKIYLQQAQLGTKIRGENHARNFIS